MSTWSDKYDSWSTRKSDLQLAEVLRGDDQQDIDLAMQILHDRYKLEKYVGNKLPNDWVEEVTHEIWAGFHRYVKTKGIEKGVSNLLWRLARNKRADAVDRLTREREIEMDLSVPEDLLEAVPDDVESPENQIVKSEEDKEKPEIVQHLLSQLSDCQRVIFVLRRGYGYSSHAVGKILGKRVGTVDTHIYNIKKKLNRYLHSEDYALWRNYPDLQGTADDRAIGTSGLTVERFAYPMTPQFAPDRLGNLDLTIEEFQTNYVTSLAIAHQSIGEALVRGFPLFKGGHPYLLLSHRIEWERVREEAKQLLRVKKKTGYLDPRILEGVAPEELVLRIDVEGENIALIPKDLLSLHHVPLGDTNRGNFPVRIEESDEFMGVDLVYDEAKPIYVKLHNPKLTIPANLAILRNWVIHEELWKERLWC